MRICEWFDQYRDGELGPAERGRFESHLDTCEDCRMKTSLLNHVVLLIRGEEMRPVDVADRVARRAFLKGSNWASDVISLIRPLPALAALVLAAIFISSLWMISGNGEANVYAEYEQLIEETNAESFSARVSQIQSDMEILDWLEQGENAQ